jgi:polyhydroxybutyrate depolymerase
MRLLAPALAAAACATAPAVHLAASAPHPAPVHGSFGCRSTGPVVQGNRTLTSGGRTRRFRLVVPLSAQPGPAPLVLNIHGLVETAELQQFYAGMDERAAARGMVMVYPHGAGNSWNAGSCCGRAQDERVDDVRYLEDLVREIESELCIDRARVYATGLSNGGMMSYRLACEASEVFAAIAPVAAVQALEKCSPRRPVPVLAFHGTSDPVVHWGGGWFGLESPQASFAKWRGHNRCSATDATAYKAGDTLCEAARGCAADTILCRIEGGGHTWPGAIMFPVLGHTSSDVDASATILDFFLDHAMTQRPNQPPATSRQPPAQEPSAITTSAAK